MSRILCVVDGMTDPAFRAEDYPALASMRLAHMVDTCGGGEAETLRCVLHLLGVENPPEKLRGYAEALGAGIAVAQDDLVLRGSWYARDSAGRCTVPCAAPPIVGDGRFRCISLGEYRSVLLLPHMAHAAEGITTHLPGSGAGLPAEVYRPAGCGLLADIFHELLTPLRCMIPWGESAPVELPLFPERAAAVCGKDIVRGIARLLAMEAVDVAGATGDVDTDLSAKVSAALAQAEDFPFVLLHINGADEASHRRDAAEKRRFLHEVDSRVIAPLLQSRHEITVVSDHGTDPESGAHLAAPQPLFTR